jgi:NDP-sugar pyrophosphorylase family protein
MIPLAILAGGRGTRLGTLTRRLPKSLVDAAGVPFIDYQLAWAARQGVRRVVLCLGFGAGQIRRHVGRGRRWGLEIVCSDEGSRPHGTAGALRLALPLLGRCFFVQYGDSYLPIGYAALERAHRRIGCPATLSIYRNAGRYDRSNAVPRGSRVARYVAGGAPGLTWIDAGVLVLTASALKDPHGSKASGGGGRRELPDLLHRLSASGRLGCWRTRRRFYEAGSRRGLAEFRRVAGRLRQAAGW